MKPEDKNKLYSIKRSLTKGNPPTTKNIWWLIEQFEALYKDFEALGVLSTQLCNQNDHIIKTLQTMSDRVAEQVRQSFLDATLELKDEITHKNNHSPAP